MKNYETNYKKITDYFDKHEGAKKALIFLYRFLIIPFVIAYFFLLFNAIHEKSSYLVIAKLIIVPATTFVVISILRLALDARRPYEIYDIKPIIEKKKKRQSMPSRHVLSATLIAGCAMYINPFLGIALIILTVIMAITRVLAGVHFIKDVVVAIIIGILSSYIGLWIL